MLLAAGRGERMRPLTDSTPKPLLAVRGKALMQWQLEALAHAGVRRVVVNTAWLGAQISAQFKDIFSLQPASSMPEQLSNRYSLSICYSHEGEDFGGALETAGGIARALPLLCPPTAVGASADLFWVLAGDVYAPDFVFSPAALARFVASDKLAHLWLVPNPAHHLRGDFGLDASGSIALALNLPDSDERARYTYSTIGLYRRALFEPPWCDIASGNPLGIKAPLGPLLRAAMDHGRVSAELYDGPWTDVGTPERLHALNLNPPTAQP
ncbi:MAG: nucleotidyltransferase family protein [Gammaproteobacteria bacterium]|nr:nucleotidyltransferase family protein [Gammaproteobacteria bacterium]MBU3998361.1 nucleotidyltransferase family protein [Gammaproteobacteria bacterium]MBU4082220.1 nucleotidyltransferase family protein [Gammaproteobacteria bacterium]MBU4112770.1 nucleotidyltransferase family protein [Gammaproteobacteria bacterium]MBU4171030.1 nucleotidyltransferase family protein [Gammaproteobacteria bacterium]